MIKLTTASLLWKCLTVQGGRPAALNASGLLNNNKTGNSGTTFKPDLFSAPVLARAFVTNEPSSAGASDASKVIGLDGPPKRAPNVFALYVKSAFKRMPSDMSLKEKFVKAAEEWRQLSDEQKDEYKKEMTDGLVRYRQEMAAFLNSMSPEALAEFKKLRKEKIKDKNRARIKAKLRKLNYPKKPCSAYIFFIRSQLRKEYPDGNYPPVRTPEHIRSIGIWSQRWRAMNTDERREFAEEAEADRKRYYDQLEQWKHDLAKPENTENLLQLERMSRKIENANRSDEEVKKKQRKVAGKIIRKRLDAKEGIVRAKKKKTAVKAKKPSLKASKKAPAKKASKKAKKATSEAHEEED